MAVDSERKRKFRLSAPVIYSTVATPRDPLVSVIMPMFNSAKFIPQTLESLLYQTMTDFEVVVIDDGSTDNSVEVVESFSARFGGRLRLLKLPHTGTPGLPRNEGIRAAHGKYIAFLDSDDLFTPTALAELSTLAENFQADVVHTDGAFSLWDDIKKTVNDPAISDMAELTNPKNFTVKFARRKKLTAPISETGDVVKRVHKWLHPPKVSGFWTTYLNFYRREFLITNQIAFADMILCEDMPFAFEALCLAKNYLIVPNITYIRRPGLCSAARGPISREKSFLMRMHDLNRGFSEFKRIVDKVPALENHPDYRYAVLEWFVSKRLSNAKNFYNHIAPVKLNDMVYREFQSADSELAANIFSKSSQYLLQIDELKAQLKQAATSSAPK